MPTKTSNGTGGGLWSNTATWSGGVLPVDNDDVVIASPDVVTMNTDTSGFGSGLNSVLVQSHATTPATLRWMSGTNGVLKIKSGSVATNRVQGNSTSSTCKGRILANASGLWAGGSTSAKFLASQSGIDGEVTDGGGAKRILTPTVSPSWVVDALIGESITINGTTYVCEDNDATTATLTTGPSIGADVTSWVLVIRPLAAANVCGIRLGALASFVTQYLDVMLISNEPTMKSVRCYGTTSAFTVNAGTDIATLSVNTSIILTANTPVFVSTSGTLPAGLTAGTLYYVRSVSGSTCKFSTTSSDAGLVDITDVGTGTHHVTHGIVNVNSIAADLIDVVPDSLPATPWADAQPVIFTSSGTYPSGITANTVYYIRDLTAASGTFKIAAAVSGGLVIALGTSWSGVLKAYIGSAATTCSTVAVLDDITSEPTTWVPTASSTFASTLGLSAVIVSDDNSLNQDIHRLAMIAGTALTVTMSGVISTGKFPNFRIYLVSRNVYIWSACTTNIDIVTATGNTTGGIFGEIRSTITGSCGIGMNSGTSCTVTSISGCIYGIYASTSCTATSISGCSTGIYASTSCTATSISGCDNGIFSSTSCTATSISGGSYGIFSSTSCTATSISGGSYGIFSSTSCTVTSISGCIYGIFSSTSCTVTSISGCIYGIYGTFCTATSISGCSTGIYASTFCTATSISGCDNGIFSSTSCTATSISGCDNGIYICSALFREAIFSGNTYDIRQPRGIVGYGTSLQSAITVYEYKHAAESITNNSCGVTIYDMKSAAGNSQPGYIGRWDVGGKTISTVWVAGTHDAGGQLTALYGSASPPGPVHVVTTENASSTPTIIFHLLEIPLWADKDQDLVVNIYAKQVTTGFDARAKFSLVDPGDLLPAELDTWTISDNTDWQEVELSTGTRTQDGPIWLRCEIRGQSKDLYWFHDITLPSGGSGGTAALFSTPIIRGVAV